MGNFPSNRSSVSVWVRLQNIVEHNYQMNVEVFSIWITNYLSCGEVYYEKAALSNL